MDNLVLASVARDLDRTLSRASFRELREDSRDRFRLLFDRDEGSATIVVSLKPELPWVGRPAARWDAPRRQPGLFAVRVSRTLSGAVVDSVAKQGEDRVLCLRFAEGHRILIELATHRANLILVDGEGNSVTFARRPRSAQHRLAVGQPYVPPSIPERMFLPSEKSPEEIDAFLDREIAGGDSPFEALRRRVFGVGTEGARLVIDEALRSGRSPGAVLVERLGRTNEGASKPVIVAPEDPLVAASAGRFERDSTRLLPWEPSRVPEGLSLFRRGDAASTAGLFHDAVERGQWISDRLGALRAVLRRELRRVRQAEAKVGRELVSWENPDRYRLWGEALLAGLAQARRLGEVAMVPDPYDTGDAEIAVPVDPSVSLQRAADLHFQSHRRAKRGHARAAERASRLAERRTRLERLAAEPDDSPGGLVQAAALEREMRAAGIPVALEPPTRSGRAAARQSLPRLEGVRLYTSVDGVQVLVGRAGPHNHRLTFRLSAPDDFWLHAAGVPGAHVVVRNDERRSEPPAATLREAAAVAAWFSSAREHEYADVHWTRRKYVRPVRGAAPGTVTVKRYATIRVRPGLPDSGLPNV